MTSMIEEVSYSRHLDLKMSVFIRINFILKCKVDGKTKFDNFKRFQHL